MLICARYAPTLQATNREQTCVFDFFMTQDIKMQLNFFLFLLFYFSPSPQKSDGEFVDC